MQNDKGGADDAAEYKKIGFMCGLEIHQRLATATKLFCSCPTAIPEQAEKPLQTVYRYQRAVAGELGDIDRSAEFEELRNRKFVYEVHDRNACLVELDEEPPHELNNEALMVALAFAKAMKMRVVDELQPMRKEVVDGSDPSAFQRTMMVGLDGRISTGGYEISIPSMFLEEESCGIVSSTEDTITYDTGRLGIPLVEIDTDPYIPTPKAAKMIALYLGTMLRISGVVQRGIGSIRQDVNVSIRGGARVEIKGLQDLDRLDKFIENEVLRQQRLLEIKDALVGARASVGEPADITDIMNGSKVRIVASHLEKGGVALAFGLKGFAGLLGREVNPQRRLGTEISDYAKMARVNGIIHTDEDMKAYGFEASDLARIRHRVGAGEGDSLVIVAGARADAERAAKLAAERAKYALVGVPLETRGAINSDLCVTRFLRPLPSGSRMYPETDAKPVLVSAQMIKAASENAPDIERERKWLESKVHGKAVAEQLLLSPKLQMYKNIVKSAGADSEFVANILVQKFTELRRGGYEVEAIDEGRLAAMFSAYGAGRITKQGVDELLKEMAKGEAGVDDLIESKGLARISGVKLRGLVESARGKAGAGAGVDQLRGEIMSRHRLNVDGAELNAMLSDLAKGAK